MTTMRPGRNLLRHASRRGCVAALLALVLTGCGSDDPPGSGCTGEGRTAISMTALDADTRGPVRLASVTVRQTDGPSPDYRYTDTRLASDPRYATRDANGSLLPLQITADHQAVLDHLVGTFDVTLRAEGYQDFERTGIAVPWTSGGCYQVVAPVTLEAAMIRRPATP